jgi:hypothetical protein
MALGTQQTMEQLHFGMQESLWDDWVKSQEKKIAKESGILPKKSEE